MLKILKRIHNASHILSPPIPNNFIATYTKLTTFIYLYTVVIFLTVLRMENLKKYINSNKNISNFNSLISPSYQYGINTWKQKQNIV